MTSIFIDMDNVEEYEALNEQYNEINANILQKAIAGFKGAAMEFARFAIVEEAVRDKYIAMIQSTSQEIIDKVMAKEMTTHEGAKVASELRNKIMAICRKKSTKPGLAIAEALKRDGRNLSDLLDNYSKKKYGVLFRHLNQKQRSIVHFDVMYAAGRDQVAVTTRVKRISIIAKTCLIITVGLAIYDIIEADNRAKEALRQGVQLGGGFAGGYLGTYAGVAAAGALCGPGAVFCMSGVILFGLIGGSLIGNEAATQLFDLYDEELEDFLRWSFF